MRSTPRVHYWTSCQMLWLLSSSLLFIFPLGGQAAYIAVIPPEDEQCFFIMSIKKPGTLFGNFDMLDAHRSAEHLSVAILDVNNNNRILYRSRPKSSDGNFQISLAENQKVQICFQNGLWIPYGGKKSVVQKNKPHDGKERTVGFQYTLEPKNDDLELQNQNQRLITSTLSLTRELGRLQSHREYMRAREAMHREIMEKTFTQLLFWAILEGAVVILVALSQIFYFRRFIERRRYL